MSTLDNKNASIFIAGHAVIDEIFDNPDQFKPRIELGGALCYSAICLKSLGYDTEIITRIGMDFPREYSKLLFSRAAVDIEEWRVKEDPTTRYRIMRTGAERRMWLASKCRDLRIGDFRRVFEEIPRPRAKVLILNPVAGEVRLQLLKRVSKEFDQVFVDSQGFTRKFDALSGSVSMTSGLDISSLAGVDLLKADTEELFGWTGKRSKRVAIDQISTFVRNLVVTSGGGVVELYRGGMIVKRSVPPKVKMIDTTGAGDIMLASLAARYLETGNMSEALDFATTAGSLAVEHLGLLKAIVSRGTISHRIGVMRGC